MRNFKKSYLDDEIERTTYELIETIERNGSESLEGVFITDVRLGDIASVEFHNGMIKINYNLKKKSCMVIPDQDKRDINLWGRYEGWLTNLNELLNDLNGNYARHWNIVILKPRWRYNSSGVTRQMSEELLIKEVGKRIGDLITEGVLSSFEYISSDWNEDECKVFIRVLFSDGREGINTYNYDFNSRYTEVDIYGTNSDKLNVCEVEMELFKSFTI